MILPPGQNTVAVPYQITLILYYISSQLVTLLKISVAHIQASDICDLTVALKFINCSYQIFLIFVPEMSTGFTSYNVCLCRVYKSMHLLVRRGECVKHTSQTWTLVLLHSKYWCQCSSPTVFWSLIIHSSIQHALWFNPGKRILVVCKFNYPYLKYLNWIPLLIVLFPPNFHDLSRIAAKVTVPHLVCLPCPTFPSSRIALSGVC
jgi:hypothetical protein